MLAALELVPPGLRLRRGHLPAASRAASPASTSPTDGTMYLRRRPRATTRPPRPSRTSSTTPCRISRSPSAPMLAYAPGDGDRTARGARARRGRRDERDARRVAGLRVRRERRPRCARRSRSRTPCPRRSASTPHVLRRRSPRPTRTASPSCRRGATKGGWAAVDAAFRALPATHGADPAPGEVRRARAADPRRRAPDRRPRPGLPRGARRRDGRAGAAHHVRRVDRRARRGRGRGRLGRRSRTWWRGATTPGAGRAHRRGRAGARSSTRRRTRPRLAAILKGHFGAACRERPAIGPVTWRCRGRDVVIAAGPYERQGKTARSAGTCALASRWAEEMLRARSP